MGEAGQSGEAIKVYEAVVSRFGADASPRVREVVAEARRRLGGISARQ
ncbi:MAG: hypothetical protein LBE06_04525 [Azoarcus sp.]|nr:hypothetical protein [Azoarcus sp.]